MFSIRRSLIVAALLCFLPLAGAHAQEFRFGVGLMGGVGGVPESSEYGQGTVQAMLSLDIATRTFFQIRVGELGIESNEDTREGDLSYALLSTEYQIPADFYQSGLFLGIGGYDLQSDDGFVDETAVGVHVGVNGYFAMNRRFDFVVEFSGHYADLDSAQIFVMGHAGVVFRF